MYVHILIITLMPCTCILKIQIINASDTMEWVVAINNVAVYTDVVNTSISVLNCPLLEDSDGTKKLVCVLTCITH